MNNIAFPKLGISLNISPVAFSIGSKPIIGMRLSFFRVFFWDYFSFIKPAKSVV